MIRNLQSKNGRKERATSASHALPDTESVAGLGGHSSPSRLSPKQTNPPCSGLLLIFYRRGPRLSRPPQLREKRRFRSLKCKCNSSSSLPLVPSLTFLPTPRNVSYSSPALCQLLDILSSALVVVALGMRTGHGGRGCGRGGGGDGAADCEDSGRGDGGADGHGGGAGGGSSGES